MIYTLSGINGWVSTVFKWDGKAWMPVTQPAAEPASPKPTSTCSFCAEPASVQDEKRNWHICNRPTCNRAAEVQRERIAACLIDCEETRSDALRWVKAQEMVD